jgi:hypothetical protein
MTEFGRISTEELRTVLGTKDKLLDATVQFMGTNKVLIKYIGVFLKFEIVGTDSADDN